MCSLKADVMPAATSELPDADEDASLTAGGQDAGKSEFEACGARERCVNGCGKCPASIQFQQLPQVI